MRLRPHHLLCVRSYAGMGYSEDFTANMTAVTDRLRSGPDMVIELVFSADDICAKCPNLRGENCRDNDWIRSADRKVAEHFRLREKRYIYGNLLRKINARMTEKVIDDICSDCAWYTVSGCREKILASGSGGDIFKKA